jgi:hypothetical protein
MDASGTSLAVPGDIEDYRIKEPEPMASDASSLMLFASSHWFCLDRFAGNR